MYKIVQKTEIFIGFMQLYFQQLLVKIQKDFYLVEEKLVELK